MKKIQKLIRSIAILTGFIVILLPLPVFAQETSGNIHIKLMDTDTKASVIGVKLSLYKIADRKESGEYILTREFQKTGIDEEDLYDGEKSQQNIKILDNYINQNKVQATQIKVSGSDGIVNYVGLLDGIYFIKQSNNQKDFEELGYRYETDSYLVVLPWTDENDNITRSVNCKPKGTTIYPDTEKTIIVYKVWKDNNDKAGKRPENIKVGLYCNGKLQEETTLDAANNWTCQWQNLSTEKTWKIKELEIPNGYVSKVTNEGNTYTIMNEWTDSKVSKNPHNTKTATNTFSKVKTGDAANILIYIIMLASSVLFFIGRYFRKK